MCVEYAQLLSTAHRVIDGNESLSLSDERENIIYKVAHKNHPSAVWTRQSRKNYAWLSLMWRSLLREYTLRYGKIHKSSELVFALSQVPTKLLNKTWSDPPQAMPDECKISNSSVQAYRQYYVMKKNTFAKWTKRPIPKWYTNGVMDLTILSQQVQGVHD